MAVEVPPAAHRHPTPNDALTVATDLPEPPVTIPLAGLLLTSPVKRGTGGVGGGGIDATIGDKTVAAIEWSRG